jgi:hypothetical protein
MRRDPIKSEQEHEVAVFAVVIENPVFSSASLHFPDAHLNLKQYEWSTFE